MKQSIKTNYEETTALSAESAKILLKQLAKRSYKSVLLTYVKNFKSTIIGALVIFNSRPMTNGVTMICQPIKNLLTDIRRYQCSINWILLAISNSIGI